MPALNINHLINEAKVFSLAETNHQEPSLYGVTDGKRVGTYLEQKFREYLQGNGYEFDPGNAASGVDFPEIKVDIKTTSITQPQSSCPFKSASQKIYGLGYSLIVFVYDKKDDEISHTSTLTITDTIFVDENRTADFQITKGINEILARDGNVDDISAFLLEKHIPLDEIGIENLAQEIIAKKPRQGYLTISNALQWRLQYRRVIDEAGRVDGVEAIYRGSR